MGATRATIQRASWLPSHQCFCFPLSPNLLSQSRHRRRRHPSSAPHPLRSSGLGCWPLRSCRLNCQSLWTSLIGRGGRLLMGGWDTHTQREQGHAQEGGKRNTSHKHTPGYEFMHDACMNNLCTCMQSHTMRTGQRRADNTNTAAGTKG